MPSEHAQVCLVAMPTTKGRGRTRGARLRARMSSVNPGSAKRQRLRHPDRASRTALPHSGGTMDDIDLADVDAMVASAQDAVREVRARAAAARKAGAGKGPRRSFQMPHPSVTVAPSALSAYAAGSVALLDLDGNSTLRHNPRHAYVRFTSRKSLRVLTSLSALYARSHNPADEPLSSTAGNAQPMDAVMPSEEAGLGALMAAAGSQPTDATAEGKTADSAALLASLRAGDGVATNPSGRPSHQAMVDSAISAMRRSSGVPKVGAALLAHSGKVYTASALGGGPVESSGAQGLSMCAERGAVLQAMSEGDALLEVGGA